MTDVQMCDKLREKFPACQIMIDPKEENVIWMTSIGEDVLKLHTEDGKLALAEYHVRYSKDGMDWEATGSASFSNGKLAEPLNMEHEKPLKELLETIQKCVEPEPEKKKRKLFDFGRV